MTQISKNGFDLIGIALHKMKGKMAKGFLGTFVFVLPLALLCLIPYAGWAIALFCWGVLETGYIRFMRRLMNGENPSVLVVFSEVKTGWFELYLGALLVTMIFLGSVLLFIPGILLMGYYSMSLFTAEYFHIESVSEALYQTSVRMENNKTTMFSYKALFYLFYFLVLLAFAFVIYGILLLWPISHVGAVFVAIAAFGFFVIIWTYITEYYHAVNETFFQEMLASYKDGKEVVKPEAEVVATAQPVEATPSVEQKPAVAQKPAPKAQPAKVQPARKPKTTTTKNQNK